MKLFNPRHALGVYGDDFYHSAPEHRISQSRERTRSRALVPHDVYNPELVTRSPFVRKQSNILW